MRPRPTEKSIPLDPLSTKEHKALADKLCQAPSKLLSEIIIKEWGDWRAVLTFAQAEGLIAENSNDHRSLFLYNLQAPFSARGRVVFPIRQRSPRTPGLPAG